MDQQEIIDRLRIQHLYAAYAYATDAGDVEAYLDCFTPDGISDVSSFVRARKAMPEVFKELCAEDGLIRGRDNLRNIVGAVRFHHMTGNVLIRSIDGDRALGAAYFVVFTPDEGRIEHYGRYEDELVRCSDDAWRFSYRKDIALYERDHAIDMRLVR